VNIRVLAVSSEQAEAEARARGVAGMFRKYYNAISEQGLDDKPVWHRRKRKRATRLRQFVERMRDREWIDRHMIMTVDELAGVAHIPNAEIETPNIDWRYTRRGDRALPISGNTNSPPIAALPLTTTVLLEDTMVFDRFIGRSRSKPEAATDDTETEPATQATDDDDSPPESPPVPQSRLGETYDIDEQKTNSVGGKQAITETVQEGTVAGPFVREMFEAGVDTPSAPLWVGYDKDPQRGFREVPLRFDSLFRHIWITGTTGYGKTTELLNMMVQWAYAGHGFTYFDPKGRDSRELLRKLPETDLRTWSGSSLVRPFMRRRSG